MTSANEDVLMKVQHRFRTFRAVKLQRVWSYRYERCLISPKRTCHKMRKLASFQFRQLWEGIISLMFVSRTKTRVLRTRVDLCYHCRPFPACVGGVLVFNHLSVRRSFLRTFEDIYYLTKFSTGSSTQLYPWLYQRDLDRRVLGPLNLPGTRVLVPVPVFHRIFTNDIY